MARGSNQPSKAKQSQAKPSPTTSGQRCPFWLSCFQKSFTWWFNHPPGPSIFQKRTPMPPESVAFVAPLGGLGLGRRQPSGGAGRPEPAGGGAGGQPGRASGAQAAGAGWLDFVESKSGSVAYSLWLLLVLLFVSCFSFVLKNKKQQFPFHFDIPSTLVDVDVLSFCWGLCWLTSCRALSCIGVLCLWLYAST